MYKWFTLSWKRCYNQDRINPLAETLVATRPPPHNNIVVQHTWWKKYRAVTMRMCVYTSKRVVDHKGGSVIVAVGATEVVENEIWVLWVRVLTQWQTMAGQDLLITTLLSLSFSNNSMIDNSQLGENFCIIRIYTFLIFSISRLRKKIY